LFDDRPDEQLLLNARAGEEAAFQTLYERFRLPLFRFAYRLLGTTEAAEDAIHDCFLSLITDATRFDPTRASLRTYLFAAARNQAFKRLAQSGETETLSETGDEETAFAHHTAEPLRRVLEAEVAVEVQGAVAGLPALQREALVLFEYEELSLAEIAEVAGTDVGTIKSRLHRARKSLRRALAGFVRDEREVSLTEK
jgi:RNA polymerase sigma-70 factor (ECF subfamily)